MVGVTGFEPATPTSRNLRAIFRRSPQPIENAYKNRYFKRSLFRRGACKIGLSRA